MPHPLVAKCCVWLPKELQNSNHMKILEHVWLQKKWKLLLIYTSSCPSCKRYVHFSLGFSSPDIMVGTMAGTMVIVGPNSWNQMGPKLPPSHIALPLLDSATASPLLLPPLLNYENKDEDVVDLDEKDNAGKGSQHYQHTQHRQCPRRREG